MTDATTRGKNANNSSNNTYNKRPKSTQHKQHNQAEPVSKPIDENSPNTIRFNEIIKMNQEQLMDLAESLGIEEPSSFKTHDLIIQIVKSYIDDNKDVVAEGILEIMQEGYGFLRSADINYIITPFDIFLQGQKIRKWNLKPGDIIKTQIKAPKDNEKYFAATNIYAANNQTMDSLKGRVNFERLTPIYPEDKINFELGTKTAEDVALRACDLVVPIGFGQRALIIAQPRTGKTMLMQQMAHAIVKNHPEAELLVLLIDERPEEVTDMKRSVKGEVISSTFDEPASRHIQIAELVIEKAKRMVELGKDVVLFLDSITRLARAYNTVTPSSGKILTGGIDASAMEGPKKIFDNHF